MAWRKWAFLRSVARSSAPQLRPVELHVLQERLGEIHANQGDAVGVELIERVDAAAAAALALGGVDHLPSLVMLLLPPLAGFGEIEDDGDQDREGPKVLQHFEESTIGPGSRRSSDRPSLRGRAG